ncbi:hypothetical protein [Rhizobium sp.]|uniref:hypothetical protein n=1 Tax=Rhizobium sp. TaxID=391 RepID=UPI002EE67860
MHSRRDLLAISIGAAAAMLLASGAVVQAAGKATHIKNVTAFTMAFGDGLRLTAVAVEYDQAIDNSKLSLSTFSVGGRTITKVYANTAATPAEKGKNGRFVIIDLSPDDANALLYAANGQNVIQKEAKVSVIQTRSISTTSGDTYAGSTRAMANRSVVNLGLM